MKNRYYILLSFLMCVACSQTTTFRVMECEIEVPNGFVVDARIKSNSGALRLHYPSIHAGSIEILDSIEWLSGAPLDLVSKEKRGRLEVTHYQAKNLPSYKYVTISSFEQHLIMHGDAANFADDFTSDCLNTTDHGSVNAWKREADGCKNKINLAKDFPDLFLGFKIGRRISVGKNTTSTAVVTGFEDKDHQFFHLGVRPGDVLVGICGIPFGEIMSTGLHTCCSEPVSEGLKLSFIRDEQVFDVVYK